MTTDTPTGNADLIKRLRAQSDPAVRERTMTFWDGWRQAIKDGEIGSWPRDAFESLLDEFAENTAQAADALEAAERVIDGFLKCAEIADCDPRDMEQETRVTEREARDWLARHATGQRQGGNE